MKKIQIDLSFVAASTVLPSPFRRRRRRAATVAAAAAAASLLAVPK
jgi:hypothetical protein